MEKALVSAATGALGPVIGKLAELLEKKYMLFKDARRNVMVLKSELEHMYSFLERLSWVEDPNEQAKLWMAEVRELSYDIEDSINDFMLHVEGGRRPGPAKLKGFKGFIRRITNLFTKIKTRCRIAKEIHGLNEQVKEAGERRARYKIDDNVHSYHSSRIPEVVADRRVRDLYKDQSELVGIDGPKDELLKLLTEEEGKNLQVSIVGPGGLGKTTLANQLFNTHGQGGKFKHRASVKVSRNPNMLDILRQIYEEVIITRFFDEPEAQDKESISNTLKQYRQLEYHLTNIANEQHLMSKIINFLNDKRYIIMVDDIWDIEVWETIKCVFPRSIGGNIVITTTRSMEIAESSCLSYQNHVYNLSPLGAMDSKKLFLGRIFSSEDQCPSHLKNISNKILKKCNGLPLAIIAVSSLLANKAHTEDQWNQVANSIGHSLERDRGVQAMIRILSLSYVDLPHHLKSCLLYISIFPHKYAIEKKSLVRRWIAEGFIPQERGYTPYEIGERCFLELINRSLIQPVKTNVFGEVKTCEVHDIILDFIVSKSIEDNFFTIYGVPNTIAGQQKKVRRLSLKEIDKKYDNFSSGLILSHARSVTVFKNFVKLPPLLEFKILRVLDIEDCDLSQEHHRLEAIGLLSQLKYLSLKNTKIHKLPEKLEELQSLETLNLKGNKITELPASIVQIAQLISLLIDEEVKLPDKIGDMLALQELRLINVLRQSNNFWLELSKLTNLRDMSLSLESNGISDAGRWNVCIENMVSSICKLGTLNLHSLSIYVGKDQNDGFLHKSWCPAPSSLKRLVIKKRWKTQNRKEGEARDPYSSSSTSSPSSTSATTSSPSPSPSHSPSHSPSPSPSPPPPSPSPLTPSVSPSSISATTTSPPLTPAISPYSTSTTTSSSPSRSSLPNWINSSLVNLEQLCLYMKEIKGDDLNILGSIPALVRLVIYVQHEPQKRQQQQKKNRMDKMKSKEKKRDKEEYVQGMKEEKTENMEKLKNKMKEKEHKEEEEDEEEEVVEGDRNRKRRTEQDMDVATGSSSNPRRRQQGPKQDVTPGRRASNRGQLKISVSHGFMFLRYLKIDGTDPRILGLEFGAGSMPKLEELVLMFKAAVEFDKTSEDFFGIRNLSRLVRITCEIDCFPKPEITATELEETIRKAVSTHPNRPRLHIHRRSLESSSGVGIALGALLFLLTFTRPPDPEKPQSATPSKFHRCLSSRVLAVMRTLIFRRIIQQEGTI